MIDIQIESVLASPYDIAKVIMVPLISIVNELTNCQYFSYIEMNETTHQ